MSALPCDFGRQTSGPVVQSLTTSKVVEMNRDQEIGVEPGTPLNYRLVAARLRCRADGTGRMDRKRLLRFAADLDQIADVLDDMPDTIRRELETARGEIGCTTAPLSLLQH